MRGRRVARKQWWPGAGRIAVFVVLLFGLCWYAGVDFARTLALLVEEGRFPHAGLLIALNVCMAAAFYAALRWASRSLRAVLVALFLLGVSVDRVVLETTDTLPSAETISLAIHDRAQAGSFFEHFVGGGMALRLLAMALTVALVMRFAVRPRPRPAVLGALVGMGLAAAAGIFLELRTGGAFDTYVEPYRLVSKVSNALVNGPIYREREVVVDAPTRSRLARQIVLLVDESIAWGHLSISGYGRDTTPFLRSIRDRYLDLGPALSSFNCSMASNYVLHADVRPDELPDIRGRRTLGKPNIFAWAQRAGYRTMYATAQSAEALTNGMTRYDTKFIDRLHMHQLEDDQGDFALIPVIRRFLDENELAFVFVVKSGAHFPWARRKYRDLEYEPVPPDGQVYERAWKAEFINAYDNLVRWNVDRFAEALMPTLLERGVMLVYTSDHGQNLFDHPVRNATHCTFTGEIPPEQGLVPLLVAGVPQAVAAGGAGFYSHFHITPSIRYAMGFDVDIDETFFSSKPRKFDGFYSGDIFGGVRTQTVPPVAPAD
jgi:lipid A ethanolaminephosphotransferase